MLPLFLLIDALGRGLMMGIIYALMGLGLTIIFGVMRIANFSHGEFYMLGAYSAYYFITLFGIPVYAAIPLSMAVIFFVGFMIERFLLHPMVHVERPAEYAIFVTFTLRLLFISLAMLAFGPFYKKPPDYLPFGIWIISGNELIALIFSVILILTISVFVQRSQIGRNWRAISEDRRVAQILGINVDRMNSLAFGVGTALAAAAGALMAPIFLVSPTCGVESLLRGYVLIAIGGLGSIPGTIAGGILVGVVEALGSVFISPAYKTAYGFLLMLAFLVVKPTGLFGEKE